MAGNSRNDLVAALRNRLSDDGASVDAFALSVTATAKSALLEISNGFLTVNVEQGQEIDSIRWNLSDPRYSTLGRLVSALNKQRGYQAVAPPDANTDHSSTDLRVEGIQDIKKSSYSPKHHRWSEAELIGFVLEAAALHNPNYTSLVSIQRNEHPLVLMKALAGAYRQLAGDAGKRKGLEGDAETFLALARDYEGQYSADRARLHRVIPVGKADESKMGTGDAVQGTLVRASLRSGGLSPMRPAAASQPPHLLDPQDDDVEDFLIRIRWSQPREQRFSHYELWRDTQPRVERCLSGKFTNDGYGQPFLAAASQYSKAGTSKQVLGAGQAANYTSPVFDGFFFWTAAEMNGANGLIATFVDGFFQNIGNGQMQATALGDPLEPDTDYYYRLYAIDQSGEILKSEVKKFRTRAPRARFKRWANGQLDVSSISPLQGSIAGGVSIAITGTGFVPGTRVQIGGKEAIVSISTLTMLTAISPTFSNPAFVNRQVDIALISPSGLVDIVQRGWRLT